LKKVDISRYISDLLFEHECVVLPGLGGFITNDKSATVNRITHRFSPPSKKIVFNVHLTANDGLLINHIALEEDLSYKKARQAVDEFTEHCKQQLEEGRRLTFDKIGILYKNQEGYLVFEQDETVNYNTEAFGLRSFHSPAIDRGTDEERLKKIVEPILTGRRKPEDRKAADTEKGTRKRYRAGASVIILFLLLLLIGGGFTFTENARNYWNNYAALIPVFETENMTAEEISTPNATEKTKVLPEEEQTRPAEESPVVEEKAEEPDSKAIKTQEIVETTEPVEIPDHDQKMPEIKPVSGSYLIIAGSFSKQENAQKLVDRLRQQGLDAMIADTSSNKMYRVALASFATLDEAKEKLYALRNEHYPDAWILRKK
jgi:cell division protein FtsN/nucleoid DNA-binding protein